MSGGRLTRPAMNQREFWAAVEDARRLAAPHAGKWFDVAEEVRDEDGRVVARCKSMTVARYIAAAHNLLLPMINFCLTRAKKAADRRVMERD